MSKLSEQPVKTRLHRFRQRDRARRPTPARWRTSSSTDHHEYTVTPDAYKILPKLVWHFDEPFADHSMIPTYYLSEVTRKEVTVALSGDGGDELFMGYPFLLDPESYSVYSKVPASLRAAVAEGLRALPVDEPDASRMAQHAYEKGYADQSYEERFIMRVTMHDPRGLRGLYSKERLAQHRPPTPTATTAS